MPGRVHGKNQIGFASLEYDPYFLIVTFGFAAQTSGSKLLAKVRNRDR